MVLQADVTWSQAARLKLGAALLALAVENAALPAGLSGTTPARWPQRGITSGPGAAARGSSGAGAPAFEYLQLRSGMRSVTHLRASGGLVSALLADRSLTGLLLTKVPPMLVPPMPWTSHATGGYLTSRCDAQLWVTLPAPA
jgi:DNA-directed RNA polymerase N-terminal